MWGCRKKSTDEGWTIFLKGFLNASNEIISHFVKLQQYLHILEMCFPTHLKYIKYIRKWTIHFRNISFIILCTIYPNMKY